MSEVEFINQCPKQRKHADSLPPLNTKATSAEKIMITCFLGIQRHGQAAINMQHYSNFLTEHVKRRLEGKFQPLVSFLQDDVRPVIAFQNLQQILMRCFIQPILGKFLENLRKIFEIFST